MTAETRSWTKIDEEESHAERPLDWRTRLARNAGKMKVVPLRQRAGANEAEKKTNRQEKRSNQESWEKRRRQKKNDPSHIAFFPPSR